MNHPHRNILVALTGQPNCGKSTLFNLLAGARQHVANFPGVTVEKTTGVFRDGDYRYEIVDLPGTYSLSSYTREERVARDFMLLERPEVVVAVADASNLERSLFLFFQLREMRVPLVLCLNMMDVAERRRMQHDLARLQEALGVRVVATVGARGRGLDELRAAIREAVTESADHDPGDWRLDYGPILEPALSEIEALLQAHQRLAAEFPPRWLAVKLLESDSEVRRIVQHHTHDEGATELLDQVDAVRERLTSGRKIVPEAAIAEARYRVAAEIRRNCIREEHPGRSTVSDRVDGIVLHPLWGIPVLLGVLGLMYYLTLAGGGLLAEPWLELLAPVRRLLSDSLPPATLIHDGWLRSLILAGFLDAAMTMLEFVPLLFMLFLLTAILEDTGYMTRIAFLTHSLLRRCGLHGQSALPLVLSGVCAGGCAVPGILAARAMNDPKARLVTILVAPLLSCSGKLPFLLLIVSVLLTPYGFHAKWLALVGISVINLALTLLVAKILSHFVVPGENAPFLLEMPPYHLPTLRGALYRTLQRCWQFIRKVFTVIVAVSIAVWALVTLPGLPEEVEADYVRRADALQAELFADLPDSAERTLQGADLRLFLLYRDSLQKALAEAEDPEAVLADYAEERPAFFRLTTHGSPADGTDAEAAAVAERLEQFAQQIDALQQRRTHAAMEVSWAGRLGQVFEPVTQLAGMDWRVNIAMLSAVSAKENVVATLETIYSVEFGEDGALKDVLQDQARGWTLPRVLALLVFFLLLPPCLPTIAALYSETEGWRWVALGFWYPPILGFAAAIAVYQLGTLLLG